VQPNQYLRDQTIALSLTVIVCSALIAAVWLEITLLNSVISEKISLAVRPADVLVGMTIYLKTSIDFAIFIGRLMDKNPGLKGRIGIEIGTALGNGVGTMAILLIWAFFREVDWLLAIMIFVASLVLLRLAQDSLVHSRGKRYTRTERFSLKFEEFLSKINEVTRPLLSRIVPNQSIEIKKKNTLFALLAMSFTIPFILGLDDFAGYVPLFDIVNVFGFIVGVLLGHMVLNISLYIAPGKTTAVIKNPTITVIGSLIFVALAVWGLIEAFRLFF